MNSHVFDHEKWAQLDHFAQLGNISSEVGRAVQAKRQGNTARMESAFYRGMDLLNATVDSWAAQREVALPELLIAREQFAKTILTEDEDLKIEQYFMDFAVASRIRQLA